VSTIDGRSAPPAISPKPGSPSPALSPLEGRLGIPAPGLPDAPALGLSPPELGALEPALPLLPDELGLLAPALPLLELEPLDPLDAGEEAPELEGEEGGVGTEGVVGVLAEGQPINVNNTLTNVPVASQRKSLG
jgi:hypothetical protein